MEHVLLFLVLFYHSVAYVRTAVVASSGQECELHILLMTSSQRFNSSGAESAVQLGMDRINTDVSILPGYELKVAAVKNTEVN